MPVTVVFISSNGVSSMCIYVQLVKRLRFCVVYSTFICLVHFVALWYKTLDMY